MVKAYSYARFSSRAQGEPGRDSLRRQLSAAYEYAEEHGLDLDVSLVDRGVSAFTGDNRTKGALRSFLNRVESGEIAQGSFLLVDSMDRLSRQMVTEATHQLLGIALAGITVVTLSDRRKFDRNASMADVMMAVIEIERSHRESVEKGRKVAAAHAESKRRAREEGRVWHRSGPAWLEFNEVTRKFEPVPVKVATVRLVFDLIEQGLGSAAIASRFNQEPRPTLTGRGQWFHSAVRDIARSRAVLGEYQPRLARNGERASRRPADGDPIPNYYGEPVVSEEQFYRVQAIMGGRDTHKGRGNSAKEFKNLFAGLGTCNACGGTVGMHTGSKHTTWKRRSVLRCNNSIRGLCDSRQRFRYEDVEAAVLTHVVEYRLPSDRSVEPLTNRINAAEGERDALARRVENLLGLLEEGDAGILAQYRKRAGELEAKTQEIADLRVQVAAIPTAVPLIERQDAIADMRRRMTDLEGDALYALRASLAASLANVIEWIEFYGAAPVEVAPGVVHGENYLMVRMKGDERDYMIAPGEFVGVMDAGADPMRLVENAASAWRYEEDVS